MGFQPIETARLIIRQHQTDDWVDLYGYLSLPETYLFEPGEPVTRETAKAMAEERSRNTLFLPVISKSENRMIGHLYFNRTDPPEFLTRELGCIFNPKYFNQGYATEASRVIVQYGFETCCAHRIVAYCNPENIASWRVLEKIGMEREGYFRKKAFFRRDKDNNPVWHDCYAYGILEPGEQVTLQKPVKPIMLSLWKITGCLISGMYTVTAIERSFHPSLQIPVN